MTNEQLVDLILPALPDTSPAHKPHESKRNAIRRALKHEEFRRLIQSIPDPRWINVRHDVAKYCR
jgi:hypothetical protein